MNDSSDAILLNSHQIRNLFNKVGELLASKNVTSEIAIYGGSALALQYDFRQSTQDVDYLPIKNCTQDLIHAAEQVALSEGLPPDWLSSAISDVIDGSHHQYYGDFPVSNPGLRVFVAIPEYILSMKCIAMRSSLISSDPFDIWHLLDKCQIESVDSLKQLIAEYFPRRELSRRNALLLEDLFERKNAGLPYDPKVGI